jgi:hypothetical protein
MRCISFRSDKSLDIVLMTYRRGTPKFPWWALVKYPTNFQQIYISIIESICYASALQ